MLWETCLEYQCMILQEQAVNTDRTVNFDEVPTGNHIVSTRVPSEFVGGNS